MSIRNMFESIMSEEGEGGEDAPTTDGGEGLMAEADDDGGGEDDLDGLGGLEGEGDDLGGFEDDDGGFAEMDEDGGGGSVDELDHRLEELEAEVGSLSSTVNTVRNENEQISESVDEVEENVRKLLDIYEMVTRGVNPFADDIDAGMAGGMGEGGGFGLFDDDGGGGTEAAIDEDIADADPEGFFDEDLVEDDEELEADADVGDVLGDEEDDGTEDVDAEFDEDFEEDGGGTSFEDLKAEYETDDTDRDDADQPASDDEATDAEAAADAADALADEELLDEVDEPAPEPAAGGGPTEATESAAADGSAETGGKPYLAAMPSGYAGELLAVEWLEYLVSEAGVRGTAGAIDYYESIDWIDPTVADALREYLAGFDGGGSASLTIDHHARSLRYISRLNGGGADALAMERLSHGGGSDGVQR